jgi:hypothetical protein
MANPPHGPRNIPRDQYVVGLLRKHGPQSAAMLVAHSATGLNPLTTYAAVCVLRALVEAGQVHVTREAHTGANGRRTVGFVYKLASPDDPVVIPPEWQSVSGEARAPRSPFKHPTRL